MTPRFQVSVARLLSLTTLSAFLAFWGYLYEHTEHQPGNSYWIAAGLGTIAGMVMGFSRKTRKFGRSAVGTLIATVAGLSLLMALGHFAVSHGGLLGLNVDGVLCVGTICTAQEVGRQSVVLLRTDQRSS